MGILIYSAWQGLKKLFTVAFYCRIYRCLTTTIVRLCGCVSWSGSFLYEYHINTNFADRNAWANRVDARLRLVIFFLLFSPPPPPPPSKKKKKKKKKKQDLVRIVSIGKNKKKKSNCRLLKATLSATHLVVFYNCNRYSEPSLQRQHLSQQILPLKWICFYKEF